MKSVILAIRADKVEVDICRTCQFIWFDGAELQSLPQRPPPPVTIQKQFPQKALEKLAHWQAVRTAERHTDEDWAGPGAPEETWQKVIGFLGMPVEDGPPEVRKQPVVTWALCSWRIMQPQLAEAAMVSFTGREVICIR